MLAAAAAAPAASTTTRDALHPQRPLRSARRGSVSSMWYFTRFLSSSARTVWCARTRREELWSAPPPPPPPPPTHTRGFARARTSYLPPRLLVCVAGGIARHRLEHRVGEVPRQPLALQQPLAPRRLRTHPQPPPRGVTANAGGTITAAWRGAARPHREHEHRVPQGRQQAPAAQEDEREGRRVAAAPTREDAARASKQPNEHTPTPQHTHTHTWQQQRLLQQQRNPRTFWSPGRVFHCRSG